MRHDIAPMNGANAACHELLDQNSFLKETILICSVCLQLDFSEKLVLAKAGMVSILSDLALDLAEFSPDEQEPAWPTYPSNLTSISPDRTYSFPTQWSGRPE
jgi:hypothetical protein